MNRTWRACIVLPTYNERDNVELMAHRLLEAVPDASVLIVDDNSPDGTGAIADRLSAADERVRVLHRTEKNGLGAGGVRPRPGRDAGPRRHRPDGLRLQPRPRRRSAPAVGTRRRRRPRHRLTLCRGRRDAGLEPWPAGAQPWRQRLRAPSAPAHAPRSDRRIQGLEGIPLDEIETRGYGFQIEMTWRAQRSGARVTEIPITFHERRAGKSKMNRRIVLEALLMVMRLRMRAS